MPQNPPRGGWRIAVYRSEMWLMVSSSARILVGLSVLTLLACGREAVVDLDPGTSPSPDATEVIDSSTPAAPDSGLNEDADADAGLVGPGDAFFPDAVVTNPDAQVPPEDAGLYPDAETEDAGLPPGDAATSAPDASVTPGDGGLGQADASPPNIPDSGTGIVDAGTSSPDSGITPDCMSDQDCPRREYCEPTQQICVDCYQDSQCFFGQVCDSANGNVCRSRCFGNFCQGGQVCDSSQNLCVDCLMNSDCGTGEVCELSTLSCVQCNNDGDCTPFSGTPRCLASENQCVECLSNSDCTAPETCNANNECRAASNRPLCEVCNDDSQCGGPNDLCLGNTVSSCGQDCSNSPCPRGYECVDVRNNTARQCVPDYQMFSPSCVGIRNLGNNCPYSPQDLDPGCGIRNRQDARCVQDSSRVLGGVCVVWCQNDDQCPIGFTCTPQPLLTYGYCL